ncbi:MAG: hypothetical protein AB8B63_02780 [Granulosicoccus sp.]
MTCINGNGTFASYEKRKAQLQVELLKVQKWVKETNQRGVALEKPSDTEPSDTEGTQWYFQRYVQHLPSAGEMVVLVQPAGVERVMNFCGPNEYLEFMRQCSEFECMLVRPSVEKR